MDRQQQEGFLVTTEQDVVKLQSDIEGLKREIKLYRDPFSRPEQLRLEQGATGAARYRTLDLVYYSLLNLSGPESVPSAPYSDSDGTKYWGNVRLPSDYVQGGIVTINWLWSSSTATDSVDWKVIEVRGLTVGSTVTASTVLLTESSVVSVTPSSVADELQTRSIELTTLPQTGDVISMALFRGGTGDASSGTSRVYSVWLKYLSFI